MSQGATSLIVPAPTKRMGFSIESLVGRRSSPSKSVSPPHVPEPISSGRTVPDPARDKGHHQSENGFTARDIQNAFQRDLFGLREQHQQQLANDTLLVREQLLLRQRVHDHLTQEQFRRDSALINHDLSRELLLREQSRLERRDSNICQSPQRPPKSSPKNSPRSSPRSSPSLPHNSSSPNIYSEEDRANTSPPDVKKSSPSPVSPGVPQGAFMSPMHGGPMLPPQFMALGGAPVGHPQIHIPTPMVQHPLLGSALPAGGPLGLGTPLPPVARDFPLYPWLLSRHGRVFQPGYPGQDYPGFLLPFRKPKRIRTAFSPSQLLKLEQAFEKNQYVVGQERKQLAVNLSLSETQVKVWFQNRRTKHKRQQQEDEEGGTKSQDKSADEGLILEHEEDEELDVMEHQEH